MTEEYQDDDERKTEMAHDGALLTPGGGKWKLNLPHGFRVVRWHLDPDTAA